MSMPMDEFLAPRIPPEPPQLSRIGREQEKSRRTAQTISVLLAFAGLAGVLFAITVLAGWPWALLGGSAAAIYSAYVIATRT